MVRAPPHRCNTDPPTDAVLQQIQRYGLSLQDLQDAVAASGRDPVEWTNQVVVLTRVLEILMQHPPQQHPPRPISSTDDDLVSIASSSQPHPAPPALSPRASASLTAALLPGESSSIGVPVDAASYQSNSPRAATPVVLTRSRSSTPRGQRSMDAAEVAAVAAAVAVQRQPAGSQHQPGGGQKERGGTTRGDGAAQRGGRFPTVPAATTPPIAPPQTAEQAAQEFVQTLRAAAAAAGVPPLPLPRQQGPPKTAGVPPTSTTTTTTTTVAPNTPFLTRTAQRAVPPRTTQPPTTTPPIMSYATHCSDVDTDTDDHPITPPPSVNTTTTAPPPPMGTPTPPGCVYMRPGQRPASVVDMGGAGVDGVSRAWEETDTLAQRIRDAARPVPKPVPTWRRRTLKLLVAGGSGLGKSTIITNLLASYWPSPTLSTSNSIVDVNTNTLPSQNHAYTTNSTIDNTTTKGCHGPQHHGLHAGHQQHTLMQQVGVEVYDEEARVVYVLVLQETPPLRGVEDVAGVVHHMKAEAAAHLEAMTRLDMDNAEVGVDAVLYLLPPHQLGPVDMHAIVQLSQHAPVIPLLAKADTMTMREVDQYRTHFRHALSAAETHHQRPLICRFKGDDLTTAGVVFGGPPFLVICSDTFDASLGRYAPVREYAWGVAEALRHSDLTAVKRLVFEVAFEEIKANTEHRLRARHQATRHRPRPLVVLATAALAAGWWMWWSTRGGHDGGSRSARRSRNASTRARVVKTGNRDGGLSGGVSDEQQQRVAAAAPVLPLPGGLFGQKREGGQHATGSGQHAAAAVVAADDSSSEEEEEEEEQQHVVKQQQQSSSRWGGKWQPRWRAPLATASREGPVNEETEDDGIDQPLSPVDHVKQRRQLVADKVEQYEQAKATREGMHGSPKWGM